MGFYINIISFLFFFCSPNYEIENYFSVKSLYFYFRISHFFFTFEFVAIVEVKDVQRLEVLFG